MIFGICFSFSSFKLYKICDLRKIAYPEIMKQPFALIGDTIIFAETPAISLNIVWAYDK